MHISTKICSVPSKDSAYCPLRMECRTLHNTRADRWLLVRNVLRVPQYACGSLAARTECSPRAAIRVTIVGCARGMFSACRNTRTIRWLRVRNVLRVPQHACGSLAARAECSPRAAICGRIVGAYVRNVLRVPQYAGGSLAARAECSLCAAIRVRIVGRACGMFSACCNTRADRWLRVRGVLCVPQYVCGSLAARAGCSPHDAIRVWVNIYCFAVPQNPG